MKENHFKSAVEAVLFTGGSPVEAEKIAKALEITETKVNELCTELKKDYENRESGIMIVKLNKSWQMCSCKEYAGCIRTVMDLKRNTPLSQAASEVLAVIAYNQPVTKAFVEQVRGVDCSGVVASLVSRELIEEKGRLELPGRPLVYGTTEHFLRCFNITSLDELPPLPNDEESEKKTEATDGETQ